MAKRRKKQAAELGIDRIEDEANRESEHREEVANEVIPPEVAAQTLAAVTEMIEQEVQAEPVVALVPLEEAHPLPDDVKVEGEAEKKISTVVAAKYKDKYIANAQANGHNHKAAKRSNWDWLSQQIASVCLNEKGKINIDDFLTLLEANEIDHAKWSNRNKGWEGRLRMTGRVALQKVVANRGELYLPEGPVTAPAEWAEKYKAKG